MKIGVSSYSYSQYLNQGKMKIRDTVVKAAEMGFEAIEFVSLIPFAEEEGITTEQLAKELKKLAADNGIEISAYVVGANLVDAEDPEEQMRTVKSEIDIAATLGVKLFRHDVIYALPEGMCFEQALDIAAPKMHEIAEYAKQYGITTMIENHGRAFQDADRMEKTYYKVNSDNFKLLVDVGNFLCADEDNVKCVSKVANLAAHVHLKDFLIRDYYSGETEGYHQTRGCNYIRGVAVGAGDARTAQCLQILRNAGFDGYCDIEFEGIEDCIEELEKGLAFIKSIL